MALRIWGQLIVQATMPAEDPVMVGSLWADTSTDRLKQCSAVSPYTFVTIGGTGVSGTTLDHNHTSAVGDGGVLTADEHDSFSDYANVSTPATPSAGHARVFTLTSNGHTQFRVVDEDGTVFRVCRDAALLVRNTSGSTITKGQACDIYSATAAIPEIRLADADAFDAGHPRHCEGLAAEDIANNGFGMLFMSGEITGLNTSGFAEGATLYLSTTPGGITSTLPTTGAGIVQELGICSRSHASAGSIEIITAIPVLTTADQFQALIGTSGTPSSTNKYVTNADSRNTDARTPTAHATSHKSAGSDPIKLDELKAPDDNTTLDASTTLHGLMPKAVAPASGLQNVYGIANGETAVTNKALFDTTNPAALGTAAPGTSLLAARRDHVHAATIAALIGTGTTTLQGLLDIAGASAGQIKFPATQNASADANTLDDYEEGSWTPVIGGSGGQSGQAYTTQAASYVKIGQFVLATFNVQLSTKGTITGNVQIKGLPFTANAGGGLCALKWGSSATSWVDSLGEVPAGFAFLTVWAITAAGTGFSTIATADIGNSTSFLGTICYRADA
jgi:hypothetical protein